MKAKPKKPDAAKPVDKPDPRCLNIDERFLKKGDKAKFHAVDNSTFVAALTARALHQPEVRAARTIQRFEGENLNINAAVDELRELVAEVQGGSMKRPEAMLVAQAHALDALFSGLALRSHSNAHAGYLDAAERYLRLALKAQSQAVRTIEALAELKNPKPVTFVRQANLAHNQQVNNGMPSHAGEIENQQSKLLEAQDGNYVDTGAARTASGANSELATLGEIDRAEVGGR